MHSSKKITLQLTKQVWRRADAVCFDVDSTVVTGEGLDELASFCGRGEEVAEWTNKAMCGGVTFRKALHERLQILQPTMKQVNDFIAQDSLKLTEHVKEVVEALLSRGTDVYLVSGGFKSIIEPIADKLNIPKDHIFANKLLFDSKGMYHGFDVNEPTSESCGKAKVVQILKQSHNYTSHVMIGDGATDMEACPPADAFIGFGGNVIRETVRKNAAWFVTDFKTLLDELSNETKS